MEDIYYIYCRSQYLEYEARSRSPGGAKPWPSRERDLARVLPGGSELSTLPSFSASATLRFRSCAMHGGGGDFGRGGGDFGGGVGGSSPLSSMSASFGGGDVGGPRPRASDLLFSIA